MKFHSVLSTATSTLAVGAAFLAMPALAQSTGSSQFEEGTIVVTGNAPRQIGGVKLPDTTKTKQVITQDLIATQRAGQTVMEVINLVPGVSFQNNDPYGSSGGTLNIRGFDASRISLTFDGIPLNDTGNYAQYSNQQLDPELIEQVNVNLGTTDVDSPTAAASGSTVNYKSRNPTEDFHVSTSGSVGEYGYFRMFGVVDTGTFTSIGTRAWISASHAENENPFMPYSKTNKSQFNAKIYQPLGDNGDFISIAGNYNVNRNRNFSSMPLRTDSTLITVNGTAPNQTVSISDRVVGSATSNRFPTTRDERDYIVAPCKVAAARAGVTDSPNSCGTRYDESYNPSNTGSIRINSRFTLSDTLSLTVDPSYQYTKANGGLGAVTGYEGFYKTKAGQSIFGYIGGKPYFGGVDLNGDGDTLDSVTVYAPSETKTNRFGVIANLIWNPIDGQTFRLNYSLDYGRHRQTGEAAFVRQNGLTSEYFPEDNPILDASGDPIQKRNRKSIAMLNQVSGEYRGEFIDKRLTVNLGVRSPWFSRRLNNMCVTEAGGSFVDCFNDEASQATFLAANPTYVAPTKRNYNFHKILPTAGLNFSVIDKVSVYANYTKGMQVPGTDNLYQSLGFTSQQAMPKPETTDNLDIGARYISGKVQAQISAWYTWFDNRLASSYDPILDTTIYRNLGKVHKYGLDGSIGYAPIPEVSFNIFGSVLKSKIQDNVQSGECTQANVLAGASTGIGKCQVVGDPIYYLTAGKREGGAPTYMFGGRIQGNLGPVTLGVQAKRTGPRYVNDQNIPITPTYTLNNATVTYPYTVYGAKTPAYNVVDLDAKVKLGFLGLNDQTYLQLNVTNLFDKFYVGGFTSNTSGASVPTAYIGAPRTVSGTITMGF
ncbi:iron complex outermembrane receptor protein [Novosphingobium sp. PhB165]|uniref:TonB-dependent receptor n=1 Tax=Novosphingobium sp. PhB165 TaxID=2485105 RepID=UPI0010460640|nr:TonB-dependent receptor [Novosphingobium sp. PhB165]TCM19487.1 iron complex outermembrane receptor protein [Novosphingobium sp. PhB165]